MKNSLLIVMQIIKMQSYEFSVLAASTILSSTTKFAVVCFLVLFVFDGIRGVGGVLG